MECDGGPDARVLHERERKCKGLLLVRCGAGKKNGERVSWQCRYVPYVYGFIVQRSCVTVCRVPARARRFSASATPHFRLRRTVDMISIGARPRECQRSIHFVRTIRRCRSVGCRAVCAESNRRAAPHTPRVTRALRSATTTQITVHRRPSHLCRHKTDDTHLSLLLTLHSSVFTD